MLGLGLVALSAVEGVVRRRLGCKQQNFCNGHGTCVVNTTAGHSCACFDTWGSAADPVQPSADCSLRVCPSGVAFADLPTSAIEGHARTECSSAGVCDRHTGQCRCRAGRAGRACEIQQCPNDCSGHGTCLSMRQLPHHDNALPLSNDSSVFKYQHSLTKETWDLRSGHACVCDSSWTVGLEIGEYQSSEWFGADCSKRQCPSGDDPSTTTDETSCHNKTATGGHGTGERGNLCVVPCSNRGICNETDGSCTCFPGFYGSACSLNAKQSASHASSPVREQERFLVPEADWTFD